MVLQQQFRLELLELQAHRPQLVPRRKSVSVQA
jgi:hypothetical protein